MVTDENNGARIFDGPPVETPLISDVSFWRELFADLKRVETEYSERLAQVVRAIDVRCKAFFLGEFIKEQPDFHRFMNDVHFIRNQLHAKSQRAGNDGEQFGQDVIALNNYTADTLQCLDVDLYGRSYRDLKNTFSKTQKRLDKRTVKYQTLSLEQEKLEIEMLRCRNEKKYVEMDVKFVELEKKIAKAEKDYKDMLDKFSEERNLLTVTSGQYAYAWKDREASKGQYVTKVLYQSEKRRNRANQDKREPRFKNLDLLAIMKDVGKTVYIEDQQFQKYTRSCSQQLKRNIHDKQKKSGNTSGERTDDDILEQVMYATMAFKKLYHWQLSLKKGQKIRQILPPNESGFAYGEVIDVNDRKSRGFYPAKCVTDILQVIEKHDVQTAKATDSKRKGKISATKGNKNASEKCENPSKLRQAGAVFAKNKDEPSSLANPFLMSKEEWIEEKKRAAEALMKGLMA